ncbi:MAG: hypothetical protein HY202_03545 [Nitrospirae bacterium]|nr:hypothetical protein [Nitrospirota bacterium]MBI3605085.1 hypothetical protein [Nitrospirota bacterium]
MKKKLFTGIYLAGLIVLGLSLTAITVPRQCSREETKVFEQFNYITHKPDFKKPQKGEFTFYQTNGPVAGGSVSALWADEEKTVYAGIFGDGIYRIRSGEDPWVPAKTGILHPFILSLYGSRKGVLFAGTINGGIYTSEDKGKNWVKSNAGLTNPEVTAIIEHQGEIFIGTGSGVFKSGDQGKHWLAMNKGMESMLVRSLLVDGRGTFFAGTGGQGIFKSTNKGKTWEAPRFKLQGETGLVENYIRVMMQSPKSRHLYAGTFGGGIFKSTDGGNKWIPFNTGLINTSIRSIQMGHDGTIYAGTGEGVYKSSNEGRSWSALNGDLSDKNIQSMILTGENQIWMGTANGVFQKKGEDPHWTPLERGISFPVISTLIGNREKGLYAGTEGEGVFRSKDGGNSWFQMNEGLSDHYIETLVEGSEHTLYVLASDGIYRGDNLKKRWILMEEGIGKSGILSLFIDSANNLFAGTEKGLFKRDMSSNYWEPVALPLERAIYWITGDTHHLFAVSSRELFLISPGEQIPQIISTPSHSGEIRGAYFKNNLYVWTENEIFEGKRQNHDLQWRTLSPLSAGIKCQAVAVETIDGNDLFFAGTDKGIFVSLDQGRVWMKGGGKGALADARSFFSPYPGILMTGTADQGVLIGGRL